MKLLLLIVFTQFTNWTYSQPTSNIHTIGYYTGGSKLIKSEEFSGKFDSKILKSRLKNLKPDYYVVFVSDTVMDLQKYDMPYVITIDGESCGSYNKLTNDLKPPDVDSIKKYGYRASKDSALDGTYYLVNSMNNNFPKLRERRTVKNYLLEGDFLKYDEFGKLCTYYSYEHGYPSGIDIGFESNGFISQVIFLKNCSNTKAYNFSYNDNHIIQSIEIWDFNMPAKTLFKFDDSGRLTEFVD